MQSSDLADLIQMLDRDPHTVSPAHESDVYDPDEFMVHMNYDHDNVYSPSHGAADMKKDRQLHQEISNVKRNGEDDIISSSQDPRFKRI